MAGLSQIMDYLKAPIPEFKAVHIYIREQNLGAGPNANELRLACKERFDRYILMEDDLEVSPNFLQYMDEALEAYANDPKVVAVTGYAYPLDWIAAPGCTAVKQNFNASAWGRGFWFQKMPEIYHYLHKNGLSKDFSAAYRSGKFDRMIDFAVKDYVQCTSAGWSRPGAFLTSASDLAMRIYLAVNDAYYIMPLVSKVRNHGYDGSGRYCQRIEGNGSGPFCVDKYNFSTQPIDSSTDFQLVVDPDFDLKANRDLLNDFDRVAPESMAEIRARAKRISKGGRYYGLFRRAVRILKG